jgi:hypothetical protein
MTSSLETGVDVVNEKLIELRNMNENDAVNRAQFARRLRIEVMEDLRKKVGVMKLFVEVI